MMSVSRLIVAIAALTLALPAVGHAADWSATFPADKLATYLKQDKLRVVVVAAGENREETRPAARALEAALRQTGKTQVVMTDEALGNIGALDDQGIAGRCAALPVDAVAVTRVFAGSAGSASSVVVVLLDRKGKTLGALNGQSGAPIEPLAGGGTEMGVSSDAVAAIARVGGESDRDRSTAQEEYDRRFIGLQEHIGIAINQYGGSVYTWSAPYQGKLRRPLEGADFYLAVGRADLASRYRTRRGVKIGLLAGGLSLFAAGSAVMLWGLLSPTETDQCESHLSGSSQCYSYATERMNGRTYAGIAMASVGWVSWMASLFIRQHPIQPSEAYGLVEEHNQKLKKELGLAAAPAPVRVSLSGGILPGGGQMSLSLRY